MLLLHFIPFKMLKFSYKIVDKIGDRRFTFLKKLGG